MKCFVSQVALFILIGFMFDFQVSAAAAEEEEAIPRTFNIPDYLEARAINLFGSVENARGSLSDIQTLALSNVTLRMTQLKEDNSIARLRQEMSGDTYNIHKCSMKPLVIDVGANIGDVSIAIAMIRPRAQVIAIEALPLLGFVIRMNMYLNNVPEIRFEDIGIVDKHGIYVINSAVRRRGVRNARMKFSKSMTQNAGFDDSSSNKSVVITDAISMRNLVESIQLPIDLLKMDCEGCEFEAISDLHGHFLNKTKIRKFAAEFHLSLLSPHERTYVKKPNKLEIRDTLALMKKRDCPIDWRTYC